MRDVYRAIYDAVQAERGLHLTADEVADLWRDSAIQQVIWTEMEVADFEAEREGEG